MAASLEKDPGARMRSLLVLKTLLARPPGALVAARASSSFVWRGSSLVSRALSSSSSSSSSVAAAVAENAKPTIVITERCAQVHARDSHRRARSLLLAARLLHRLADSRARDANVPQRILQLNLNKGVEEPALQRLLRVSVEPGGCSGFSYKFELEDATNIDDEEDAVFEKAGARVVVDESSLELVSGSTVDFEEEMMKAAFVITANPQSSASCGCGTSFQVEL